MLRLSWAGWLAGINIVRGTTRIQTVAVNAKGRGAAEGKYGADFSITLEETGSGYVKAILGQAKRRAIAKLGTKEQERFGEQCKKMASKTDQFVSLTMPSGASQPKIGIGKIDAPYTDWKEMTFADYLVDQFVACKHGDKDKNFINAVQTSDLAGLRIIKSRN